MTRRLRPPRLIVIGAGSSPSLVLHNVPPNETRRRVRVVFGVGGSPAGRSGENSKRRRAVLDRNERAGVGRGLLGTVGGTTRLGRADGVRVDGVRRGVRECCRPRLQGGFPLD